MTYAHSADDRFSTTARDVTLARYRDDGPPEQNSCSEGTRRLPSSPCRVAGDLRPQRRPRLPTCPSGRGR
jgi:hypothetical protein